MAWRIQKINYAHLSFDGTHVVILANKIKIIRYVNSMYVCYVFIKYGRLIYFLFVLSKY